MVGPLSAALLAGCTGGGGDVPTVPAPVEVPPVAVTGPDLEEPYDAAIVPPAPAEDPDPILHSPWGGAPGIAERVAYWTDFFGGRGAEEFTIYLSRMGAYEHLVDSALVAEGLPRSLRYLPIVESGYRPGAVSRASAVGLWQFMAPVARSFGMQVTSLVDERRDPVKSTLAAARYLRELEERFGSWFLALAGYNGGPNRVDRLLRTHAPLAPPGDSLFVVVSPYLPRETRDFVPKLLAAAAVAEDPDRFGISVPEETLARYDFDETEVPDATSLDVVAEAAGVEESLIRMLNPHLVRGVTPRGQATGIRLPPGTAERFAEAYALVPPDERITVTEHVVSSGESFWTIARQYGVRVSELEAANPRVDARRMQIGTRLMVPLVRGSGRGRAAGDTRAPMPAGGVHVVRRGESLWTIARRYGLTVARLRSLNGLGDGSLLQPGDRLRVDEGG